MRVAVLCGYVEPEVLVVLDGGVAQSDNHLTALLKRRLEKQRLERRVQLLAHVLEEHGVSELDRVLELADEIPVGELDDYQVTRLLHLANPLIRLALRVDDQRPAPGFVHHDGVVHGEGVVGQTINGPLLNLHRLTEHCDELERVRARDAARLALLDPLAEHLISVRLGKRAEVRDIPRAQQHVAREVGVVNLETRRDLLPALLLAAQSADELLGANELFAAHVVVKLELSLLVLHRLELIVQRLDLILDLLQLSARLVETDHETLVLLLRLRQLLLLRLDNLHRGVVSLHGADPAAKAVRSRRNLLDLLGLELGPRDVGLDLLDDLVRDRVLVVAPQLIEELRVAQEFDGGNPVVGNLFDPTLGILDHRRLHLEQDADRLHDQLDNLGRVLVRLHVRDVLLGQGVERGDCRLQDGDGRGEFRLALNLDRLRVRSLLRGVRLVLRDARLHLVRVDSLQVDLLDDFLSLDGGSLEHRLEVDEFRLHNRDGILSLVNLRQTALVAVDHRLNLVALLVEQPSVGADELEVRRGGDVIVTAEVGEEFFGEVANVHVELHAHVQRGVPYGVRIHRDVLEELRRHAAERILGPLAEPVDRAAVNERGELAQSLAEGVANRGEAQHHVQVPAALVDEKLEEIRARTRVDAGFYGPGRDHVDYLRGLVLGEHVGHLAGVQDVVDVLQERLHLDLGVVEQENRG